MSTPSETELAYVGLDIRDGVTAGGWLKKVPSSKDSRKSLGTMRQLKLHEHCDSARKMKREDRTTRASRQHDIGVSIPTSVATIDRRTPCRNVKHLAPKAVRQRKGQRRSEGLSECMTTIHTEANHTYPGLCQRRIHRLTIIITRVPTSLCRTPHHHIIARRLTSAHRQVHSEVLWNRHSKILPIRTRNPRYRPQFPSLMEHM